MSGNGEDVAFPADWREPLDFHGLSKREIFAALAMAGWIANHESLGDANTCARKAVQYADALLIALANP